MRSTTPLRVVIVDDQPAIRQCAESLLEALSPFILVGSCGSVSEARGVITAGNPDILVLDINLGDGTGFDILEYFPYRKFKVIFLTAYEEYALPAIKAGAIDYLLKPINEEEFNAALLKAADSLPWENGQATLTALSSKPPSRIVLSSQQHLQVVDLNDIMYCQSDFGYTSFHLSGGRKILTSKYIKEYEASLPPDQFLRTHQSFLVNIRYIDHYHRDGYLLLHNGAKIPVATRRKEIVKNSLTGSS